MIRDQILGVDVGILEDDVLAVAVRAAPRVVLGDQRVVRNRRLDARHRGELACHGHAPEHGEDKLARVWARHARVVVRLGAHDVPGGDAADQQVEDAPRVVERLL